MSPRPRGDGLIAGAAFLLTLLGVALWAALAFGPWRLADGLLNARDDLQRAERQLSGGSIKKARLATLSAAAAADRARAGLDSSGPLLDLVSLSSRGRDLVGELPHLVTAAEKAAAAAVGSLEVAQDSLRGPNKIIVADDGGSSSFDLDRLEALAATVQQVRSDVRSAASALEQVDPTNLPRRLRPGIADALERAADADVALADAEAGLAILPAVLGRDGPRTYLIGMQNSAEQRGTGGNMLQSQLLALTDGTATLAGNPEVIYNITERTQFSIPLPEDAWYNAGEPDAQRFKNANWSPDWPLSASLTVDYARAAAPEFPAIDGVIAVDPIVMQNVMPAAGPYRIQFGNRITARKAVHFLLYRAYGSYPVESRRDAVLGQVVDGFFERLLDPVNPSALPEGLGNSLSNKHMQIWMADPSEQAFIEAMDWDGAIDEVDDSDYLYVVEQNVGGNKLDYYARQSTTMNVRLRGDDAHVSTRVDVLNGVFLPQPRWPMGDSGRPTQCFSRGACPLHRPMLNIYAPGVAELSGASVEGTRLETPPPAIWSAGLPPEHTEKGKKVWSATLEIPPGKKGAFSVDYVVPAVVQNDGDRKAYRIVLQHQPKVRPDGLKIVLRLPAGATDVRAPGWTKKGRRLVWERPLSEDIALEVTWAS